VGENLACQWFGELGSMSWYGGYMGLVAHKANNTHFNLMIKICLLMCFDGYFCFEN
jgi:hypothetical protein